jgi:hypothetical protein
MKKYAADNLMFLRDEYPEIYKLVRNRTYDAQRYSPDTARNGDPIVALQSDSGVSQWLYSRYNPVVEADRWTQSVEPKVREAKDVLLFGFGFGYHAEAFLSAYPDKRVYIFEPDTDLFLCALECRNLKPVLKQKSIAVLGIGDDLTQIAMLEEVFNGITGSLVTLVFPSYRSIFGEAVQVFERNVRQLAVATVSSLHTLSHFGPDWVRNKILNMVHNLQTPSIQGMKGSCAGIPAVIVGSGPSLGMEMETLRQLKNRALIVAAGTSIQALLKHGVEPHLVVSMDPGEHNFRAFEPLDIDNVPLLYIPTIHSGILDKKCRYKMHAFFQLDTPTAYFMGLTGEDPIFVSTATVSGTAIQAAIYFGCSEIYLIGQDFSFPNDRFYADGVSHLDLTHRVQTSTDWVENVQGGQNRTDRSMNVLREGIERLLMLYPECHFYNASAIGAKIKHTQCKSLSKLYGECKELDDHWFLKILHDRLKPYSPQRREEILRRMEHVLEQATTLEMAFNKIKEHLAIAEDHMQSIERTSEWLTQFQSKWSMIVENDVFKYVYGFFLQRELNYIHRHWPDLLDEKNLQAKSGMLLNLLEPLLEGWNKFAPLLNERLQQLGEKLNIGPYQQIKVGEG